LITNPVIGVGDVGMNTDTDLGPVASRTSANDVPVTNPRLQMPLRGYCTSTDLAERLHRGVLAEDQVHHLLHVRVDLLEPGDLGDQPLDPGVHLLPR
jgi:hypothetical protein